MEILKPLALDAAARSRAAHLVILTRRYSNVRAFPLAGFRIYLSETR